MVFTGGMSVAFSRHPEQCPPAAGAGGARELGGGDLRAEDLQRWGLVRAFLDELGAVRAASALPEEGSLRHVRRELELPHYLGLFLLGLLNPVITTLRGLVRASHLQKVQEHICARPVSLGSMSEMQSLSDAQLLECIFARLGERLRGAPRHELPLHLHRWLVQDGSLMAALPRMAWALYGGGRAGCPNNAVRLHLSFDLEAGIPVTARSAPGRVCERAEWEKMIVPGCGYIGDRYYGESHLLLTRLCAADVPFVIRLRDEVTTEVHAVHEVPAEASAAGVLRDETVRLGTKHRRSTLVRHLTIRMAHSGEELRLVTNLSAEQLSAADAALLYKRRWEVEYFFRWMKCVLGNGRIHWLAESARGVQLQLLLTLIGGLLLQLHFGERPGRRMLEAWQLCLMGMATPAEAARLVERERQSRAVRGTKKKSLTLR